MIEADVGDPRCVVHTPFGVDTPLELVDATKARVVRWPDLATRVRLEPALPTFKDEDRSSTTLQRTNPKNPKCIHVVLRKTDSAESPYEVWIDGFRVEKTAEETYELPSFQEVYDPVLQGVEFAACVTPIAISMLVEHNARPPELCEVLTRQRYLFDNSGDTS